MVDNEVWRPFNIVNVIKGDKVLTSTQAYNLKSNGMKRTRINGGEYEQVDGVQYDGESIYESVTN